MLLGGAFVAWALPARAQQSGRRVIGFLSSDSPNMYAPFVAAFLQGLKETGHVEGQDIAIEYRWAESHYERLPALAADLVQHEVAAICVAGNVATHAAKAATASVPVVFITGDDAVSTGLVSSLNRPEGNVTGMSMMAGTLPTKRLQLLSELRPAPKTVAMLVNPNNANAEGDVRAGQIAARAAGLSLLVFQPAGESEFASPFATMSQKGVNRLIVNSDSFFTSRREQIVALATRHRVPAMYSWRQFVEAGGLMSYGASWPDMFRAAGVYVGRILNGQKPTDLPVMQATKFYLVINLKTAKALSVTIPDTLLALADEVIE
jgi:putative ABC transport system substrate-binding protein